MPLSLTKLGSLLYEKDFIPLSYMRYESLCVFIEIVSLTSGISAILYIPSRFKIPLSPGENVHEIELIDMEDDPADYFKDPVTAPEETYSAINLVNDEESAETQLKSGYKKSIKLKSGEKSDVNVLKSIIRQLNRLQYCVDGLPYHLVIYESNYLCFMRDGESDCYVFKEIKSGYPRSLRVTATLETFHGKGLAMDDEMNQISLGIQKILDKNMSSHARYLDKLVEKKGNLLRFASLMGNKKSSYDSMVLKYRQLLAQLSNTQRKHMIEKKKFCELDGRSNTFDKDLQRSQIKSDFDRKIQYCVNVKRKILDEIIKLQSASDALSLSADKILYDNSVMMDKMFKNFASLIEISR